jgi:hypothetical protein
MYIAVVHMPNSAAWPCDPQVAVSLFEQLPCLPFFLSAVASPLVPLRAGKFFGSFLFVNLD